MAILLGIVAVLLYVLIIMGDDPKVDNITLEAVATAQPQAQMPQDTLRFDAANLYQAEYYFSEPFLHIADGGGWRMDGVLVLDYIPEGTAARVRELRLQYVYDETGQVLLVSTITPATSLRALPARGFATTTDQDWTMCGLRAVMMRNGTTLHLHAERGDVVYQVEGEVDAETLRAAVALLEI